MIKFLNIILLLVFSVIITQCKAQQGSINNNPLNVMLGISEGKRQYGRSIELSTEGDAYQFMSLRGNFGANNVMLKKRRDNNIIAYQMSLIENVINASRSSRYIRNNKSPYQDHYQGWVSGKDVGTKDLEVPLYESYSFFYIAQFLYYLKINGWSNESRSNRKRWYNAVSFLETNIWEKWYVRSKRYLGNHYWYFLRGRTHMGSHWAGIAMYLNDLTYNSGIKEQTTLLIEQYDILLRRNLKQYKSGYIWNSTYDDVRGTFATQSTDRVIQDVAHGNHVVAYIVAAYEKGNERWTLSDIKRLSWTLTDIVYDEKSNLFKDNVDGTSDPDRPGWGNYIGDGWAQLVQYDSKVKNILIRFENARLLRRYAQELQFKANLYYK